MLFRSTIAFVIEDQILFKVGQPPHANARQFRIVNRPRTADVGIFNQRTHAARIGFEKTVRDVEIALSEIHIMSRQIATCPNCANGSTSHLPARAKLVAPRLTDAFDLVRWRGIVFAFDAIEQQRLDRLFALQCCDASRRNASSVA